MVKASVFVEAFMGLFFLVVHIASIRNWLAPHEYLGYQFIMLQSVRTHARLPSYVY
jgi:hypothetical protein